MKSKYYYLITAMVFLAASVSFAESKQSVSMCKKDSDCALIVYDCNQAVTFNKSKAVAEKNKLCKIEDCSLRDCEEFRHFNHAVQCLENVCSVKNIAKDDLDPGGKKWIKRFVTTKRPNFAKNKNENNPVSFGIARKPARQ